MKDNIKLPPAPQRTLNQLVRVFLFSIQVAQFQRLCMTPRRQTPPPKHGYNPHFIYDHNDELREVIKMINSGCFSKGDCNLFKPITDSLLWHDPFMLMADYPLYIACQDLVADTWKNTSKWNRMAIMNVARMGKFSSDRSIQDYCEKIWKVKPFRIK